MRFRWLLLLIGCVILDAGCDRPGVLEKKLARDVDRRLLRAAIHGDVAEMDAAIKDGADPNASSAQGWCILRMTYSCDNKIGFEHLLELGADPHRPDENGLRTIHFVASNHDSEWIEMILKHGGDPNIRGVDGKLPFSSPDTPIFDACSTGNLKGVEVLVKHGANINAIGVRDQNVVVYSAHLGSPIVTKWLIEHGADWKQKDLDGVAVAESELHREFDPEIEPEKLAAHEWILKFLTDQGVDMKAAEERSKQLYMDNFRPKQTAAEKLRNAPDRFGAPRK